VRTCQRELCSGTPGTLRRPSSTSTGVGHRSGTWPSSTPPWPAPETSRTRTYSSAPIRRRGRPRSSPLSRQRANPIGDAFSPARRQGTSGKRGSSRRLPWGRHRGPAARSSRARAWSRRSWSLSAGSSILRAKEGTKVDWQRLMPQRGFKGLPRRWVERTFSCLDQKTLQLDGDDLPGFGKGRHYLFHGLDRHSGAVEQDERVPCA
jgi:hypothetical protein